MGFKKTDSCLKKVADDEMIFVLRAQDKSAPRVILHWMAKNFDFVSEEKLREAFEVAMEMKKWKNKRDPD